jgi:hypothetical protein
MARIAQARVAALAQPTGRMQFAPQYATHDGLSDFGNQSF